MYDSIILAGNGPSAQADNVRNHFKPFSADSVFRTNYFYLPENDALDYTVDNWFICQHDLAELRGCMAFIRGKQTSGRKRQITFWIPGIEHKSLSPETVSKHLPGFPLRVQKEYHNLPMACRWEHDLAPERPLMGSFALAVAVGMQPKELYICGLDLFQHPSNSTHGMNYEARGDWQTDFNKLYLSNIHRNHTFRGDLKYISAALNAYKGMLYCVGSVMKRLFADEFPQWEWLEG